MADNVSTIAMMSDAFKLERNTENVVGKDIRITMA